MSDETSCNPSNVIYPTISAMFQKMKEESDLVVSRSNHTLSISNEAIEIDMNMSNTCARMVKAVNVNQ